MPNNICLISFFGKSREPQVCLSKEFFAEKGCPASCGVFCGALCFCPPGASSSAPTVVTTKNGPRHCKMSLGE